MKTKYLVRVVTSIPNGPTFFDTVDPEDSLISEETVFLELRKSNGIFYTSATTRE